jgi:hypothetical protein
MFTLLSRATWYTSSCIQTNRIRVGGGVFQISDICIPPYTEYNNHVNSEIKRISFYNITRPGQGRASGCNALTTNLDAPSRNSQNIKDKHTDQPAKQGATHYRIHVSPLVNRRSWTKLIFKNVYICGTFCVLL